ncbi:MAG: (2Fe-2S) ferredoxin domain-containing protein [Nitrospinota bacterium]
MPKPKVHFFTCSNQRPQDHPKGCCEDRGAEKVWATLRQRRDDTGLNDGVLISRTKSCMAPCQFGPVLVVYPDNVWYAQMDEQKAAEVFDSHVKDGKPVEKYLIPEGAF